MRSLLIGVERERGPNIARCVGIGKRATHGVSRPPSRAVAGNDQFWRQIDQFSDGVRDDRLEEAPGEVKTTYETVDMVYSCDPPHVMQHIDDSRMAATRENHKTLVPNVDCNRLIVPGPSVGLPPLFSLDMLKRKALLEIRDSINLSRDQYRAAKENRRSNLLDHLPSLPVEITETRRGQANLRTGGEYDLPFPPSVGMNDERHRTTNPAEESLEPTVMISMPV